MSVAERWDSYAADPDLYVCSEHATTAPTLRRVLDAMPDAGTVLDLGCGQGRLAVPVAEARPNLSVVGLDISPAMLAAAPQRPRVQYLLGDGSHVVGPVDGAWSVLLFQHLPPETVYSYLTSLAEHIAPGGPLLVQFVAGDYHLDLDHRYRPSQLVGLAEAAGFKDVAVCLDDRMSDWWWLTATASAGPATT